ncbi:MAG: hypothetical protein ABH884_04595, partial [Candidatus Komeilibacteria bacterium]
NCLTYISMWILVIFTVHAPIWKLLKKSNKTNKKIKPPQAKATGGFLLPSGDKNSIIGLSKKVKIIKLKGKSKEVNDKTLLETLNFNL